MNRFAKALAFWVRFFKWWTQETHARQRLRISLCNRITDHLTVKMLNCTLLFKNSFKIEEKHFDLEYAYLTLFDERLWYYRQQIYISVAFQSYHLSFFNVCTKNRFFFLEEFKTCCKLFSAVLLKKCLKSKIFTLRLKYFFWATHDQISTIEVFNVYQSTDCAMCIALAM